MDLKAHWDNKYSSSATNTLGWYEAESLPSLKMIKESNIDLDQHIFVSGAGATTLVDSLLHLGYRNITAADISSAALGILETRLGDRSKFVDFLEYDLASPESKLNIQSIDFWHDRAVLHFLCHEAERANYFKILKDHLSEDAFVMLGEFSNEENAAKCSNLPVFKYSSELYKKYLGEEFEELTSFHDLYTMPSGDTRDYIYALFKRIRK